MGGWKVAKAYGIGTEMGISPGDSWGCNYFPLTENRYLLFAFAFLPLNASGLLPRPDVCIG